MSARSLGVLGAPVSCVAVMVDQIKEQIVPAADNNDEDPTLAEKTSQVIHIAYGQGCFVHLEKLNVDHSVASKVIQIRLWDHGNVHGIRSTSSSSCGISTATRNEYFAFGGRQVVYWTRQYQLAVSEMRCSAAVTTVITTPDANRIQLEDWVWDVQVVTMSASKNTPLLLAIGLSHNHVDIYRYNPQPETNRYQILQRWTGTSRSILYSMHILCIPRDQHDLQHCTWKVASGTVMNEIVVWECKENNNGGDDSGHISRGCTEQRLIGHTGAVHQVRWNSNTTDDSNTNQYLVSCSDDRSVRLWNTSTGSQVWCAFGHKARVWDVQFCDAPVANILSSSEDGTVILFNGMDGSQLHQWNLTNQGSVWCLAVYQDKFYAGTHHGRVEQRSWSLVQGTQRQSVMDVRIAVPDDRVSIVVPSIPTEPSSKKKKTLKQQNQVLVGFDFYDTDDDSLQILFATRLGNLFDLNVRKQEWTKRGEWREDSVTDQRLGDGTCMAIHPLHSRMVAIGTSKGFIRLVGDKQVITIANEEYRSLQKLQWIDPLTILAFHVCATVYHRVSAHSDGSISTEPSSSLVLLHESKGIPISAAFDSERRFVVVGDTRGALSLFHVELNGARVQHAISRLGRVHNSEHINGIYWMNSKTVISVGNDGSLQRTRLVIEKDETVVLTKQVGTVLSQYTGCTHIWPDPHEKQSLLLGGYAGNVFIMSDISNNNKEIFRVDTGGRGRNIAIKISDKATSMCICEQQSDGSYVARVVQSPPRERSLGSGLHTETIFDARLFFLNSERIGLLTASEDCSALLSIIENGSIRRTWTVASIEGGARAVTTCNMSDKAMLAVGGGKLCIVFLMAYMDENTPQLETWGMARFPDEQQIDHRVNCLDSISFDRNASFVVSGDSNGGIHVFVLSKKQKWQHGRAIEVYERPIFSIKLVKCEELLILLAGTSDGMLLIYLLLYVEKESSFSFRSIARYQIQRHDGGVNAIDSCEVPKSTDDMIKMCLDIATGGDDQSVSLTRMFVYSDSIKFEYLGRNATKRYSAVRGIAWVSDDSFVASGYDQRLITYRRSSDDKRIIEWVGESRTNCGDVNFLSACVCNKDERTTEVLVATGGLGVDLQLLSTPSSR